MITGEENFEQFFKQTKNIYREYDLDVCITASKPVKEKFEPMSVHTFNALNKLRESNLVDEAIEKETHEDLKEFYQENIEDNKNSLYSEIDYGRIYQEIREKC